jgi:transcriptional regulator with XRE-family HTH domain
VATELCAVDPATQRSTVRSMSEELVEALRNAIELDERSYNAIGRAAGVDPAAVWRFVKGERSIDITIAAKLCKVLGLKIVGKPAQGKRPRGNRKG